MSEEKSSHPLRHLRNLFITGLLVLVPIGTTALIVYKVFDLADRKIRILLEPHIDALCQLLFNRTIPIPPYGVGLVVTVLVILAAGILARNLIGRRLISLAEKVMLRLPFVNRIYTAIKQISDAFLRRKTNLFQEVVLIEYPRRGIYSLGFVTGEAPKVFDRLEGDSVCIFVSTTPNPTSGVLVVVPRRDVIPLNISVEDGMKMVISGGVVIPENLQKRGVALKRDQAERSQPAEDSAEPAKPEATS